MKKYFAKWLHVEGEIREGDYTQSYYADGRLAAIRKIIKVEGDKLYDTEIVYTLRRALKKVKLFLCTKDIEVDDEVQHPAYDLTGMKVKQKFLHKDWHLVYDNPDLEGFFSSEDVCLMMDNEPKSWVFEKDCWKVIGEISPEAVWVKEGDEFDEDDLRFWHNMHEGLKHQGGFVVDPKVRPDWAEWVTHVQIKCSQCKHFH